MGRIVGAHGIRGLLRLGCDGDPETLSAVTHLTLGKADADSGRRYAVTSISPGRSGELRLNLEGVGDRDAAEALRGCAVWAEATQLARLAEGEFYGFELIGCGLEAEDGSPVGTVRGIWQTGAPDVLVVEAPDGRERLVPAALLRSVDVAQRRAVAEIPPGLLEDEP